MAFHPGELAVQRRAGTADEAARLAGMLAPAQLRGGIVRFLAERTLVLVAARDRDGRLWVSPLAGPPGFLSVTDPGTLAIAATPPPGDPLHDPPGGPAGLLVIDLATRRRVRINGELTATGGGLAIEVEQAYGNCPQYIHRRLLAPAPVPAGEVRRGDRLSADDLALLAGADTFFVGTAHPSRGADASHRGGPAGFLRPEGDTLVWPDFPGNGMFNTFGNLAADPAAALFVPDLGTGRTLHLAGSAEVEWNAGPTGRQVRFRPEVVVSGRLLPLRV